MRRQWLLVAALLAATLVGGTAYADSALTTAPATNPAPTAAGQGELPLVLSIRALSLGQNPLVDNGDTERVRASTGAGTSRWPSATTSLGRGVYISVMPGCIPGVDEPLLPGRPGVRRR